MQESKTDKIVYLRRLPLSNSEKNSNEETQEYFNQGNRHLGSYFVKDSVRPGSGLTLTEEKLLMPAVVEMSSEDQKFIKESSRFFNDIYLKVPPHDKKRNVGGLRLNVSLEDDSKPLSKDNLPKSVLDYVKYRFILSHPLVAASEKEGSGNSLKEFYIFDESVVKAENVAEQDIKDAAMSAYLSIKDDEEKILQFLIFLNIPRDEYLGKEALVLRKQAEVNPSDFMKAFKNKHIEIISLLKEMIEARIVERAGDRFIYVESKDIFAVDEKDALTYLKDPANSNDVLAFKAKIQKFRRERNKS